MRRLPLVEVIPRADVAVAGWTPPPSKRMKKHVPSPRSVREPVPAELVAAEPLRKSAPRSAPAPRRRAPPPGSHARPRASGSPRSTKGVGVVIQPTTARQRLQHRRDAWTGECSSGLNALPAQPVRGADCALAYMMAGGDGGRGAAGGVFLGAGSLGGEGGAPGNSSSMAAGGSAAGLADVRGRARRSTGVGADDWTPGWCAGARCRYFIAPEQTWVRRCRDRAGAGEDRVEAPNALWCCRSAAVAMQQLLLVAERGVEAGAHPGRPPPSSGSSSAARAAVPLLDDTCAPFQVPPGTEAAWSGRVNVPSFCSGSNTLPWTQPG